jgi:alkylhydroperoxidase family enzyme
VSDGPGSPRIPPIPPREWPEAMGAAVGALRPAHARLPFPEQDPDRPKGRNALGTFAHHPDLTTAFHTFNGHVLFGTTLSMRQRELLVLRVAARRQCEYEWLQHVVLAGDAGLSEDDVARAGDGPDADGWSTEDAALLRAVDDLLDTAKVGDDTWAQLAATLEVPQLMDVVFTVGAYDLVAMAFLSFGVQVDDDLARWRKRHSPE